MSPHRIHSLFRTFRIWLVVMVFVPWFMRADELYSPSMDFRTGARDPLPNVNLPSSISAADGVLTLQADFAQAKDGKVPLYLVNRTAEKVIFSTQDYDIFLKLERKTPDGRWERVQSHQYSWCGNSYISIELAAGHHFAFAGYMPMNGIKAQVRYRSYGSVPFVSNEGEGFFLEQDRITASLDQMALKELPESLRFYFNYNPAFPSLPGPAFTEEKFLSALRLLSTYRESPYARQRIKAFLTSELKQDENTPKLVAAINEILAREWPAEPAHEALLKAALAELPEHPIPAWSVLTEFMQNNLSPNTGAQSPLGKQVAEELKKASQRDNAEEMQALAKLIGSPRFAGEYLDDAFLESWLRSPHDVLVRECANALCHRLRFDRLAKIGLELQPSAQLIILRALATSGSSENETPRMRDPDSDAERDFWIKCATEEPLKAVSALYYTGMSGDLNRFNLTLHEPLKQFLISEANSPSKDIDGWQIGQVVSFVGAWKRKDDTKLFRSLLVHPAYQRSELTKSSHPGVRFESRRYRVREEALRLLIAMGEPVPANLVLEEEKIMP